MPPPSTGDWEHVKRYPAGFRALLDRGQPPPQIRLALFDLYRECIEEIAEAMNAEVVDLGAEACGPDGFLAARFLGDDPAHGNTEYGAAVLARLMPEGSA